MQVKVQCQPVLLVKLVLSSHQPVFNLTTTLDLLWFIHHVVTQVRNASHWRYMSLDQWPFHQLLESEPKISSRCDSHLLKSSGPLSRYWTPSSVPTQGTHARERGETGTVSKDDIPIIYVFSHYEIQILTSFENEGHSGGPNRCQHQLRFRLMLSHFSHQLRPDSIAVWILISDQYIHIASKFLCNCEIAECHVSWQGRSLPGGHCGACLPRPLEPHTYRSSDHTPEMPVDASGCFVPHTIVLIHPWRNQNAIHSRGLADTLGKRHVSDFIYQRLFPVMSRSSILYLGWDVTG